MSTRRGRGGGRLVAVAWILLGPACGEAPGSGDLDGGSEGSGGGDEASAGSGDSDSDSDGDGDGVDTGVDLPGADLGPSCPPAPCEACVCIDATLWCDCAGLGPEAGFTSIDEIDYELGLGDQATAMHGGRARLFWSFRPADLGGDDRPLFVFFNGGPGVSSGLLLGLNTGPRSFDPALTGPGLSVADNPASWTALGNLLWIDARQTGYGQGLLDDPAQASERSAAMNVASFNAYFDAADFVRVLLRFMAAHPSLRDNEVVLVAESYGGTRAQIMLDMLLRPAAYGDGSRRLRDPALVAEIQGHHQEVLGDGAAEAPAIAEQFGHQVLIQPALTGIGQKLAAGQLFEAADSPLHAFAAEFGVTYPTCAELGGACSPYDHALDFVSGHGRSPYDTRAPLSWLDDLFDLVNLRLNDSASFAALLEVEAASVVGLAAGERQQAWRAVSAGPFPADAAIGDWPSQLGPLQDWDRYFVPFHHEVLSRFTGATATALGVAPNDGHFGELFLANLLWVETLITVARYDLVVYTPALPLALSSHGQVIAVEIDDRDPQRPRWQVHYAPGAFPDQGGITTRSVAVPTYAASHAVSLDAGAALRDDVGVWLAGG